MKYILKTGYLKDHIYAVYTQKKTLKYKVKTDRENKEKKT